jgi:hypothetical protein
MLSTGTPGLLPGPPPGSCLPSQESGLIHGRSPASKHVQPSYSTHGSRTVADMAGRIAADLESMLAAMVTPCS